MASKKKASSPLRKAEIENENKRLVTRMKRLETELESEKRLAKEAVSALEAERTRSAPKRPTVGRKRKALKGDKVEVIFGDVHGNKHDPEAWKALLNDLRDIQPDRVFIGGDFIDCGGFLAEHHTLGYIAESEDSYIDDCAVSNVLLDSLQNVTNEAETHYLEGNHEWRVERWALTQKLSHHKDVDLLRRTFHPKHVLDLDRRGIRYYEQGKVHADKAPPGWVRMDKLWYVHKLSNSRNAASAAVDLASSNVVYFDSHRIDYMPKYIPGQGMVSAWNPGCLCQRQPLYCNTRPTNWNHGYLLRFITPSGNFQMVPISIDQGVSYGGAMFRTPEHKES